jgi:hypothetical protein
MSGGGVVLAGRSDRGVVTVDGPNRPLDTSRIDHRHTMTPRTIRGAWMPSRVDGRDQHATTYIVGLFSALSHLITDLNSH